jgi:uncharacterized protein YdgA (DUF945 family)
MVATLNNKLVLVLCSITLVIGSSYFLTGKIIQDEYIASVAKINSRQNLKVSLLSYDRGLIHSHVKLEVELPAAEAANRVKIPLQQTITHGPIIAVNTPEGFDIRLLASQVETTLDGNWQEMLKKYTNAPTPLILNTLVDFEAKANTWLALSAANYNATPETNVSWDALNGQIEHDLSFSNYQGNINLAKVFHKTAQSELTITDLNLRLNAAKKDKDYTNSNILRTKALSFKKFNNEVVKLDDITLRFDFNKNAQQNIELNLIASVVDSKIVNRKFAQDSLKLQISNLSADKVPNLPGYKALSLKSALDFTQQLTAPDETKFTLELPKDFSEALLAYVSYELYRSSSLGKMDRRDDNEVLQDISKTINSLAASVVKQKLFIDHGEYYALNFDRG